MAYQLRDRTAIMRERHDIQEAAKPANIPDDIGERLRRIRQDRGYTVHQAARYAGIASFHLEHIEEGSSKCSPGTLLKIARGWGIDVERITQ